jgi:hypothetical protein
MGGWNTGATPVQAAKVIDKYSKARKIEKHIEDGADKAIGAIAKISQGEPEEAIAMLMVAACALARAVDMPQDQLFGGIQLAWDKTHVIKDEVPCTTP